MSDAVLAATSLRYTCLSRREYSGRISSTRRPPMALSQSVASELLEAFRAGEGWIRSASQCRQVMQELTEARAVQRVGAGRCERSDQSTAPTEQLVACESLLVTKVLMVGRYRWSLGSRWSGRPHVLPGLRTADPAQHLLRHHRGVEVDDHSMRSVVVAFQASDPFGVHPDPAAGEGEQLGLYGR